MPQYARLTRADRDQIQLLSRLKWTQVAIAAQVGCHQSTVSRELARMKGWYCARLAHQHARARAQTPVRIALLDSCPQLVVHLRHFLVQRYSIAQALGLIARKYSQLPMITAAAVYNWLFSSETSEKRELRQLLIRPRMRRRPRRKPITGKGKIANMRPIRQRPAAAEDRSEVGHLEGDLVVSGPSQDRAAIATLVDRKTRYTLVIKVPNMTTKAVVHAVAERLRHSRVPVKSITWDQGPELSDHLELSRRIGAPVYFADAHSPWQRGTNENSNGVLRRWHPKGTSLNIHPAQLRITQERMNNRPMPVLSGASPREALARELNMR